MDTYIAPVSAKFDGHGIWTLIPLSSGPVKSFLEPSQLPGEYAAHAAKLCSATSLIKHNYHLCPHRSPFILPGEEKQS